MNRNCCRGAKINWLPTKPSPRSGNRTLTLFWDEFRYDQSKEIVKDLEYIQYQRRKAMAIPFIIQCDLCLKWRVLPSSSTYQEKESLDMWICANNPNHLENSCDQIERLPSIPLGTMNRAAASKNEKDRRLQESVQRYQNRLADLPPQYSELIVLALLPSLPCYRFFFLIKENSQIQRIRPSGDNLTQGSRSSFEFPAGCNSQKRSTEDADSDVEFVSMTKVMKRPTKKKVKGQQQRRTETLPGGLRLTGMAQVSSLETERRQSVHLVQESKVLTEVETSDEDPDIILSKSSTNVSLKQEKQEAPLITKEKQELYNDIPVMKRSSSVLIQKSLPSVEMEDLSPSSGHKVNSVSGDCQVPSSLMSSQSTSSAETARKLMSNLREILLYFVADFQLSSEFKCTAVEDLIASPKLEGSPEQINEKLRACLNQIQNVYMIQYEKRLKRKIQAIIYEANRRGILNEVFQGQCEQKKKVAEDKLNSLRTKLVLLLQKLRLDCPVGDLEQTDAYLETLLKEDNLQTTLNGKALNTSHALPL
ncbi:MORC family CW-type zinc finger protein 1 [Nannospalax galili]|uniref:MORC family CW-type zinc finger protein 1 n=1 Tax=Nannospalax galili TaxID=1026970 RepID=UPI0004ED2B8C|nr:MORC family CW-type zinc finger protein 1 [Nannospalax galili]